MEYEDYSSFFPLLGDVISPFQPLRLTRFLKTIQGMGVPFVNDVNLPGQPPNLITKLRTTVTEQGKRSSAYEAFLPTNFVRSHKNLKIGFGVVVQKIDIVQQDGLQRVEGVFLEDEKCSQKTFYVKGSNVILCAGAVASAQLLLLRCVIPLNCSHGSGIGPKADLEKLQIPVKVDLPGVGKNLVYSHPTALISARSHFHSTMLSGPHRFVDSHTPKRYLDGIEVISTIPIRRGGDIYIPRDGIYLSSPIPA